MKIQHRSCGGQLFYPTPEINYDENLDILFVAFSWSESSYAKKAVEIARDYMTTAESDSEVTNPFEIVESLSPSANHLKIAIQLVNENLYRKTNQNEYLAGVEMLLLQRKRNELAWAAVGQPSLFYMSAMTPLAPLSVETSRVGVDPLPQQLVGIEPSLLVRAGQSRLDANANLLLSTQSVLAPQIWSDTSAWRDLNALTYAMLEQNSQAAFWMGLVQLD